MQDPHDDTELFPSIEPPWEPTPEDEAQAREAQQDARFAEFVADTEADIDRLREAYGRTRNPLDLWEAYSHSRRIDRYPPQWILLEFERIAELLGDLTVRDDDEATPWHRKVLHIFGFPSPKKGPTDPFKTRRQEARWLRLAIRVRVLVDGTGPGEGQNLTDAFYLVASRTGSSEPTVRRAWMKFNGAAREQDTVDAQRQRLVNREKFEAWLRANPESAAAKFYSKMRRQDS